MRETFQKLSSFAPATCFPFTIVHAVRIAPNVFFDRLHCRLCKRMRENERLCEGAWASLSANILFGSDVFGLFSLQNVFQYVFPNFNTIMHIYIYIYQQLFILSVRLRITTRIHFCAFLPIKIWNLCIVLYCTVLYCVRILTRILYGSDGNDGSCCCSCWWWWMVVNGVLLLLLLLAAHILVSHSDV